MLCDRRGRCRRLAFELNAIDYVATKMELFVPFFELVKGSWFQFASVAGLVVSPAAAFGFMPRLGPGRAVVLAVFSHFRRADPVSLRQEVPLLRRMITSARKFEYVVVVGPKGVGKTCVVDTATQRMCGVVVVNVEPGATQKEIMNDAFVAITRSDYNLLQHRHGAFRVLWWHNVLFRTPATVVLRAAERKPSETFAALDSAARALTQEYGAHVVIDASNNSMPEAAVATKREKVLEIEPMPRSLLQQLPELLPLHDALKTVGLADVVWAVVGGNPADYLKLLGQWEDKAAESMPLPLHPPSHVALRDFSVDTRTELVVAHFVKDMLAKAIKNVNDSMVTHKHLRKLYELFQETSQVPYSALLKNDLLRPSPDKVLRAVQVRPASLSASEASEEYVLVPADAATKLVLRWGCSIPPTLAVLKEAAAAAAQGE